jgi:hypothetical protein
VNGKIFWAGTETSCTWPGFFDGAVNAGKVAARDVCKARGWPYTEDGLRANVTCETKREGRRAAMPPG